MTIPMTLSGLHTLVLAGGGNRCWWQAGALQALMERGWALPQRLAGTSAGAAIAMAAATDRIARAFDTCRQVYREQRSVLRRVLWSRGQLEFAHQTVYPAWLQGFVDAQAWAALGASGRSLLVGITRPARAWGLRGSIVLGSLAYLLDKQVAHSLHPRLPRWLGLRLQMLDAAELPSLEALTQLLRAAGAAPPLMSPLRIEKQWALDGGYVDNAPVPDTRPDPPGGVLVMLSRHYPERGSLFMQQGRHYWQPSRPVPVSTWDCTARATVDDAFALGQADARTLMDQGCFRL